MRQQQQQQISLSSVSLDVNEDRQSASSRAAASFLDMSSEIANKIGRFLPNFGSGGVKDADAATKSNNAMESVTKYQAKYRKCKENRSRLAAAAEEAVEAASAESSLPLQCPTVTSPDVGDIISLQLSSGVFQWGQVLSQALRRTWTEVEAGRTAVDGVEQAASVEEWVTALVVVLLEKNYPKDKELWELVVGKAKTWLRAAASVSEAGNEEKYQKLVDKALEFVRK